jgi:predicted nucleic acid-binding protein
VTTVVVDASVAIKWMLVENLTPEATALLRTWVRDGVRLIVPAWFVCEVSNVLLQRLRDRQIRLVDAQDNLRDLTRLVTLHPFESEIAPRAIELAQTHGLAASYDCLYLALAERLSCDLWTADENFWNTVKAKVPQVKWVGSMVPPPPPPPPPRSPDHPNTGVVSGPSRCRSQ